MGAVELVIAKSRHDKRGKRLHAAGEESHHIERRLVSPVDVLEHHHRGGSAPKLVRQRGRHLVGQEAALDQVTELTARGVGHSEKGTQWARGEQRIAAAPQNPYVACEGRSELAQQGRLADARLAADEHDPAGGGASHHVQRVREGLEFIPSLEQIARDRLDVGRRHLARHPMNCAPLVGYVSHNNASAIAAGAACTNRIRLLTVQAP